MASVLHDANMRLCRLRLWSNYDGFGFSLTFTKQPYAIQLVELFSPAAAGGLRQNDVILVIDNQDALSMDPTRCFDMIVRAKERNGRIELLVVSKRSYRSLKKHQIPIDVQFATVIDTPAKMPDDYPPFVKYQPRLCDIYLSKSDERFGLDITGNREGIGACISQIHPNTPASRTKLRADDRIIEINKRLVDEKHKTYIFKKFHHARLLRHMKLYVMDADTYQYYQSNQISLSSKNYQETQLKAMKNIKRTREFLCLLLHIKLIRKSSRTSLCQ